jgi:hypothetical protein
LKKVNISSLDSLYLLTFFIHDTHTQQSRAEIEKLTRTKMERREEREKRAVT